MPMRILIACYTFPPSSGIGGRRWAKFAKYLQRAGAEVTMVAAAGTDNNSPWANDVVGINQTRFISRYPIILTGTPKSVFDRLWYRLQLLRMRWLGKGTPYDRALLDRENYKQTIRQEIARFNPEVIIATGAPFRILSFTAELRLEYPEIKFFADFRDPWTWGEAFGYNQLNPKRLRHEQKMEQNVVQVFDGIWSPWSEIITTLSEKYPSQAHKFSQLPHAFDLNDLPPSNSRAMQGQSDTVRIIYGGTIYKHSREHFEFLARFVSGSSGRVVWQIYAQPAPNWLVHFSGSEVKAPLASQVFFAEAAQSDWLVLIIPPHAVNGVPTKVLEYAALGKPIVMLGHRGDLSDFVLRNKLGLFAESEADLSKILFSNFAPAMDKAQLEAYRFDKVTARLLECIAETRSK